MNDQNKKQRKKKKSTEGASVSNTADVRGEVNPKDTAPVTVSESESAINSRTHRITKEVQAESVAYTVCQHYEIDTSDYSFGYVAGWSSDKDMKELKSSLDPIQKTAKDMIKGLDKHLNDMHIEKSNFLEKETDIKSDLTMSGSSMEMSI